MPADSRGGPLTTDRPTAENPGEKFTPHGTPNPRQSAAGRTIVSGVVELDLSRHVDRAGLVMDHARYAVHGALADCPAGVDVRIRLGRASYVYDDVLDTLAAMTEHARSVEVVGTDARGVAYVVPRLRASLEAGR